MKRAWSRRRIFRRNSGKTAVMWRDLPRRSTRNWRGCSTAGATAWSFPRAARLLPRSWRVWLPICAQRRHGAPRARRCPSGLWWAFAPWAETAHGSTATGALALPDRCWTILSCCVTEWEPGRKHRCAARKRSGCWSGCCGPVWHRNRRCGSSIVWSYSAAMRRLPRWTFCTSICKTAERSCISGARRRLIGAAGKR